MTSVRVGSSTVQIVRSGATGGTLTASQVVAQLVHAAHARRVLVTSLAAQIIRQGAEGGIMRVSQTTAQVIRSGSSGGALDVSGNAVQVVYSVGVDDAERQRAWSFDLDGHAFYVLDLGDNGALLHDITTGEWTLFETTGYEGHWNMKNGFHWTGGGKILGGDISSGAVYELDPDTWLDDGWRPVVYEVRGVVFATDVNTHRQYALRLIGSAGRTADSVAPVLNMQYSDDNGATWSSARQITLTADFKQRIEWRSLGAFTHPGRLFRLYDQGGVKFIAMVVADIEGAQ